jgi:hypothetical protein
MKQGPFCWKRFDGQGLGGSGAFLPGPDPCPITRWRPVTYPTRWTPVSLPGSDRARDSAVHLEEYVSALMNGCTNLLYRYGLVQARDCF